MRFEELDINDKLLRAIEAMGFEEATPIQERSIPVILEGRDVVGQAQTGTGKTASFSIPMLNKIDPTEKSIQSLILCPTRELAIQVSEEIRKLTKYMHNIKVVPIYGGQDIVKQIRILKTGVQVVIGTPGRVMDHMRRKTIKLDTLKMMILDEADEMLNMGFREDIETILQEVPDERQTILFSATMPKPILDITKNYQKNAQIVKVVPKQLTVKNIDQYCYQVRQKDKEELLANLLDIYNPTLSIIFCNTKKRVDELVTNLQGRGYSAAGFHGDLVQQHRDRVMSGFRSAKTNILVATDVAARGIDVDDVDLVFNYDLPQDEEYYVHRIGRTGRAGRSGLALTFICGREKYKLREIERYCKTRVKQKPIPTAEDVKRVKIDQIFKKVTILIQEEDLSDMSKLICNKMQNAPFSELDLASAFLKISLGDLEKKNNELEPFKDTGAQEGMVRFFINIGKRQKVRPGDILGAVAGESHIPGKCIGAIDMFDKFTFIEVPEEYAMDVFKSMPGAKIKGKSISIEPANQK